METPRKSQDEKYCHECGELIRAKAEICPKCGVRQTMMPNVQAGAAPPPMPGSRKCPNCGYIGPMKTWLGNYNWPQFFTIILLLFYILPGLLFIAWAWGKHKCPNCGHVGRVGMADASGRYRPEA